MQAEIISIGTELLLGDITDTNSKYIAQRLTELGYDIHYITSVGDNQTRLTNILSKSIQRSDLVITTGGLGPTDDDLTREAISLASGQELYKNEKLLTEMKQYFRKKGYNLTENNYSQAYLPHGAQPIKNDWGTASGIILQQDSYQIISLPGVPGEMKKMFDHYVLPELKNNSENIILSKTLHFFGIGESTLETKLYDILQKQDNPTLALLAGKGEVKLRITAKGKNEEKIKDKIEKQKTKIVDRVGEYLYGIDDSDLAVEVYDLLMDKKLDISVAESCTGGLIGHRITQVPGSSKIFLGGTIVYSNKAKINLLNIKEESIREKGAVSEVVAKQMAENVAEKFGSEIGIGVTGIAGPGGGSKEKPVGLVYIGFYYRGKTEVYQLNLNGSRSHNKWMTSQYALFYVYKNIKSGRVNK